MTKEAAQAQLTCRACGHVWVPAQAAPPPAAKPAAPKTPGDGSKSSVGDTVATPSHVGSVLREDKTDPLVGTVINGFKILSRIGTGGFGVVYRAFDTNLERSVAIKMLPPKIAKASQGLVERFLREARSAAKLSHPNIVTIHQICPYRDTYYIVMELVDGGALHEYLAVQKHFTPQDATRIIRAAAEGLGHAHRRGIIHRDIKPGNIMMTHEGQVKVSDFGLARDVLQGRDIVGPGHSLGTPRYMAPEQALGGEPTSASDLYSLAATYYALLTGRAPFEGASDRELMKKHVTSDVPDPRQFVPSLPVAAFRFFEKAMAKQPEDRYQTAEEFVEALDRLDFSTDALSAPAVQALQSQIANITAEDRGSHLTEALDRAVKRVQTQRTPASPRPALADTRRPRKGMPMWAIWAIVGGAAAVLIIVAVAAAFLLAPPKKDKDSTAPTGTARTGTAAVVSSLPSTTTPAVTPTAPVLTPVVKAFPTVTAPVVTPSSAPKANVVEKGTTKPPPKTAEVKTAKTPESEAAAREAQAQEALKVAKEYEADPNAGRYEVKRYYQESVVDQYYGTQAAKEAQEAIDRIEKEMEGQPPSP
jgi:serine/threonine protein kinase